MTLAMPNSFIYSPEQSHQMNTVLDEIIERSPGFPLLPGGSAPTSLINSEYSEGHDRRILIVDDEESVRTFFATYLGETYSCEVAANAQEALDILAREPFALVVTDMQMPGLSGIELLRKITEHYRDTAVIIVSGIARTQRVMDAIRVGASDYLIKPCDLDVLTISVERALERRMLLRNARRYKTDLEHRNAELARQKTEMERLQAQVLQADKMASLGQLAAGVAHELNNPAGFIYSNIDLLKGYIERLESCLSDYDKLELPAAASARISAIKSANDYDNIVADLASILSDCQIGAERIRDIVQNLRLFSRLDEAEVTKVDLNQGIESTVRLLSKYYLSGRIGLVRDYGEIPLVNCYAAQLNQVWMNLLANAGQAIGDGAGEVRITTRCEGRTVLVSISDTGPGISPEQLKRIFDPFFTTKAVGEGTGLGLSITHGIIERHGGKIEVESAPGNGTTFIISLPVDADLDLSVSN
ncbi:MAG: two-component system, NtrC family, sensor kinase [Blastocatellia bacterium]|nr:two-component system, NtrC family, sensor kinase [Blastocatellia bacterium]